MSALSKMLLPLVAALLVAAPAAGATYTVGSDGVCTHANLLSAVLSAAINPGPDEVRLARNLTYTNQVVHLTNWSPANALTIAGGYDDCADGSPTNYTIVDGPAASPVFEIDTNPGGESVVTLRRLQIEGSGVRGVLVEGNSHLTLNDVVVWHNDGGGISVTGGALLTLDAASRVIGNDTLGDGAGIYCQGAELEVAGDIGKSGGNEAQGSGGGIFASDCVVLLQDGAEVRANIAFDRGGGIYVEGDSYVHAVAGAAGIIVSLNGAGVAGGGLYATGPLANVLLEGVRVEDNRSDAGVGLFATDGAVIVMDRLGGNCFGRQRCSTLSLNTLTAPALDGAAAVAEDGAHVRLYQTYVEGNVVPSCCVGSVLRASGGSARIRLEGVSFWGNDAARLIEVGSGGIADVAFVSATGNGTPTVPVAQALGVQQGGAATLNSSVFHPSSPILVESGAALAEADCLILSNVAHLPVPGTHLHAGDPMFRSPATGDLHLASGSPAVDFCDTALYLPAHGDGDGEVRGFDLAANPNGSPGVSGGLLDLGFDEVRPLFADGFESGDTSAWSSTVP